MINFGGEECICEASESDIHILPVPYDATSTWIKGSEKGPEALLEASLNLEFYDIETGLDVRERGIFTLPPLEGGATPGELVEKVRMAVSKILNNGRFPVVVGGNHTVSIGSIQAFSEKYPDLTVLQLDAHTDLRSEYLGSPFNHACAMARAREVAPVVQVGIRSVCSDELQSIDPQRIFYAHLLHQDPGLYNSALDLLNGNVYVTIDLDVFDPSVMPSTGTPEPGGLLWYDIVSFLRKVSMKCNVVGFDVVELCPSDTNRAPDFMAAKLIYQFLSYISSR
ncbi:MAG: agmatinase [Bacteroidales bacterium]